MKRQFVMMLAVFFACPLYLDAQVGKLMSRYHEQPGVTVTQLDKSLYGLYQRDNLPPEASEMLQKIDEVNIFSVNLAACKTGTADKAAGQFRGLLDDAGKYKLIKSRNDDFGKQLIYTRSQDGPTAEMCCGEVQRCSQSFISETWTGIIGKEEMAFSCRTYS